MRFLFLLFNRVRKKELRKPPVSTLDAIVRDDWYSPKRKEHKQYEKPTGVNHTL